MFPVAAEFFSCKTHIANLIPDRLCCIFGYFALTCLAMRRKASTGDNNMMALISSFPFRQSFSLLVDFGCDCSVANFLA